jgi:predicted protein tyrosine phosphatase
MAPSDSPAPDLADFRLTICGLDELDAFGSAAVTHVLSILDPEAPLPAAITGYAALRQHWVLRFHDVSGPLPGARQPDRADVEQILAVAGELDRAPGETHLLVHCHAGVSRSTAAAAILLARCNPGRETEAFEAVAQVRPGAWPNRRMVELADDLLGREGRLSAGLSALRAGRARRGWGFL